MRLLLAISAFAALYTIAPALVIPPSVVVDSLGTGQEDPGRDFSKQVCETARAMVVQAETGFTGVDGPDSRSTTKFPMFEEEDSKIEVGESATFSRLLEKEEAKRVFAKLRAALEYGMKREYASWLCRTEEYLKPDQIAFVNRKDPSKAFMLELGDSPLSQTSIKLVFYALGKAPRMTPAAHDAFVLLQQIRKGLTELTPENAPSQSSWDEFLKSLPFSEKQRALKANDVGDRTFLILRIYRGTMRKFDLLPETSLSFQRDLSLSDGNRYDEYSQSWYDQRDLVWDDPVAEHRIYRSYKVMLRILEGNTLSLDVVLDPIDPFLGAPSHERQRLSGLGMR